MRSRWFKTPLTKEVWKPQCCLALLRPSMFLPSQAVLGSAKSVSRMQENFATLHAKPWQTSFGFTGCFLRWMNFGKSWTCRMNMQGDPAVRNQGHQILPFTCGSDTLDLEDVRIVNAGIWQEFRRDFIGINSITQKKYWNKFFFSQSNRP